MKPRNARQTRNAKIQSRNAPLRTSVLSFLTLRVGGYFAAFDVPCRAEEALRRVERDRVHAARERSSRRWHREVVGTCEPRDRVEQDDDVSVGLDESLRALERELGDSRVVLGGLVKGR